MVVKLRKVKYILPFWRRLSKYLYLVVNWHFTVMLFPKIAVKSKHKQDPVIIRFPGNKAS